LASDIASKLCNNTYMKPVYKSFATFAVGFAFFVVGVLITVSSQKFTETIASQPSSSRDPAAIKRVYDFSGLEGSALNYATKQRLLDGFKVIHEEKDIGLELGHFVMKGKDGTKEFACQKYSKVVMTFAGEGSAQSGEMPTMEIEGTCEISPDINSIAAIWIPVARILGEPVADGEFDFREGRTSKLKFANVADQWPRIWQLRNLKLVDPTGENTEIFIEGKELRETIHRPLIIEF
jgi:hypothetical protein